MSTTVANAFATTSFQNAYQPHGMCYLWEPDLVWTHVTADGLIALAYFSIPVGLVYVIRKRDDVPFDWMFVAFAVFILACGTTHLMAVWTLWNPDYWVSAWVKVVTAGASLATAALMVPLIPKALALPSHDALEERNRILRREVAERRKAEAELSRQMGILNGVLDSMHAGVVVADADGRITITNRAADAILGRPAPSDLPEEWPEHYGVYPDDEASEPCRPEDLTLVQALEGREVSDRPFYIRYADGSPGRWISATGRPIRNEPGDVVGGMTVFWDVTQEREREREIQELHGRLRARLHDLGEVNDQLEGFAHSVSHDLRAPLRSIEGFSTALLQDCAERLDDTCRDYAERIAASASRMGRLIQDLLEYSRLTRSELSRTVLGLDGVLGAVLDSMQSVQRAESAEIRVEGETGVRVLVHEGTLFRVLANLVSNALTYVEPGVAPEIVIDVERTGDRVRVTVTDNGIGIEPEHHERVFKVFERLHGRETYPGTGMGLAIVAKGIERMGGSVGVDSTPGAGSRFWIEMEAAP